MHLNNFQSHSVTCLFLLYRAREQVTAMKYLLMTHDEIQMDNTQQTLADG